MSRVSTPAAPAWRRLLVLVLPLVVGACEPDASRPPAAASSAATSPAAAPSPDVPPVAPSAATPSPDVPAAAPSPDVPPAAPSAGMAGGATGLAAARAQLDPLMRRDGFWPAPSSCQGTRLAAVRSLAQLAALVGPKVAEGPARQAALALAAQARALDPASAEVQALYAEAALDAGRLDEARAAATAAIEACPRYAYAHNLLGRVAFKEGALKTALASFRAASQAAPGFPAPRRNAAAVLLQMRLFREADGEAMAALRLDEGDVDARLLVGAARLGAGEVARAAQALEGVVSRAPTLGKAWALLGQARAKLGKADGAREAYCRAAVLGVQGARALCDRRPGLAPPVAPSTE